MTQPALRFRGGKAVAALPLVFFIGWAIAISVAGAPDENGLILGAAIGLVLGMFLCKNRWWDYAEEVFTGMANRIATVAIVAWFWAGTCRTPLGSDPAGRSAPLHRGLGSTGGY